MPQVRAELPHTDALSEADVLHLLHSKWHEERLLAHTQWINNWDLVDTSAPQILGAWLLQRDRAVPDTLAASTSLREQRIATQAFIRAGEFADTLRLSALFLSHPHDLIHKSFGWMLREVGKRDVKPLLAFHDHHAAQIPRTMLRYALAKFSEPTRQSYLAMKR